MLVLCNWDLMLFTAYYIAVKEQIIYHAFYVSSTSLCCFVEVRVLCSQILSSHMLNISSISISWLVSQFEGMKATVTLLNGRLKETKRCWMKSLLLLSLRPGVKVGVHPLNTDGITQAII